MVRLGVLVCLSFCFAAILPAADWEMSTSRNAGVTITHKDAPVVNTSMPYWGAKWKYAAPSIKAGDKKNGVVPFTGSSGNIKMKISGDIKNPKPNQLVWTWKMDVAEATDPAIGGGFQFILKLDSASFGGDKVDPVLLPGSAGWRWEPIKGQAVEIRFDPPCAKTYFEREKTNQIRCFLYDGKVEAGKKTWTMTVTLPEGGAVVKSLAERYGPEDPSTWMKDLFAWDKSPVDLSFLNHKPAGKHGIVKAKGDDLVFADGTPAKFWGANVQAYGLFNTEDKNIPIQAKRIAQLGFNLIRIHHHDSSWTPNVFFKDKDTTRELDPEKLAKLDLWVKSLKDEGVYVWIDLHVGRNFRPGDGVDHFAELANKTKGGNKGKRTEGKGYCYLNKSIEERMQEYAENYLNHVGKHTGKAWKDEPAIMGILITNENDLVHHFGNGFLGDKGVPNHHKIFKSDLQAFCEKTGLDPAEAIKTWVAGPSKIYLNDVEHRWNVRMIEHLTKKVGAKNLYSTTNLWGGGPAFTLPALSDSTIIDTHSYGNGEELSYNPRYRSSFLCQTSLGAIYGKPVAITEWNMGSWPTRDRFYSPVFVAAVSAIQAWDAPMLYGYSQTPMNKQARGSNWSAFNDPGLMASMPAAALLYRQGHVKPANEVYCLKLSKDDMFMKGYKGDNSATIRTLLEQHRFTMGLPATKELPWVKETVTPEGVTVVTDPNQDFIPKGENHVQSDTGEVKRDWKKGIQTIDTDKTQIANGWVGGETIKTKDVEFAFTSPKAVVAVQSLDDKPIATSGKILITTVARVNTSAKNEAPFLSEPVQGKLTVHAAAGKKLYPKKPDGTDGTPITGTYADGKYTFTFGPKMPSHWFELR